ncbi:MAG TPA: ABC transporter ATP-binding protein [Pedococcus sp.]|nr:ABC transporter ATP-binding protein [Pedococcus sp.]
MLELMDVGFAYAGGDWVFRGVTIGVGPGTATAVLGPNGRGKTTLARCAAGLLKPTEGSVCGDGSVGFVPQSHGSAFAYPVREMVLMGRAARVGIFSVPGRQDRAAANAAMERVGISHLAQRAFPTLSGGEQQLVLIARAVASGSPVLVLDEPAASLDLRNQAQVLRLLRLLVGEGMALLLTTHHPDHALYVADSVVLLGGPEGVACGSASRLLTRERLSALYGIEVDSVTYRQDGHERTALVTAYERALDVAALDVAAEEDPLTPAPTPSAPRR